jgi:hypothetical protein
MTHGSGYFGFESFMLVALTVLAVVTLGLLAHAAMSPLALV